MDERKKKMAVASIQIHMLRIHDEVIDVINQIGDDDFSGDWKVVNAYERLNLAYKELIEVINNVE